MASVKTIILSKSGEVVTYDKEPSAIIKTLRNGRYVITIAREKDPRSISQNNLMWMWFEHIARELKCTQNQVHDHYCNKFLRYENEWNGTREVNTQGTKYLKKEQMTEFLNNIQADVLTEFGISLPIPEDKYFEQFYQTYR